MLHVQQRRRRRVRKHHAEGVTTNELALAWLHDMSEKTARTSEPVPGERARGELIQPENHHEGTASHGRSDLHQHLLTRSRTIELAVAEWRVRLTGRLSATTMGATMHAIYSNRRLVPDVSIMLLST